MKNKHVKNQINYKKMVDNNDCSNCLTCVIKDNTLKCNDPNDIHFDYSKLISNFTPNKKMAYCVCGGIIRNTDYNVDNHFKNEKHLRYLESNIKYFRYYEDEDLSGKKFRMYMPIMLIRNYIRRNRICGNHSFYSENSVGEEMITHKCYNDTNELLSDIHSNNKSTYKLTHEYKRNH
jgi:hypothetical protein